MSINKEGGCLPRPLYLFTLPTRKCLQWTSMLLSHSLTFRKRLPVRSVMLYCRAPRQSMLASPWSCSTLVVRLPTLLSACMPSRVTWDQMKSSFMTLKPILLWYCLGEFQRADQVKALLELADALGGRFVWKWRTVCSGWRRPNAYTAVKHHIFFGREEKSTKKVVANDQPRECPCSLS